MTDRRHIRNIAFALLTGAILVLRAAGAGFVVDTANREESRVFFNAVYSASEDVPMGFTGDVSTGNAGTTSAAYREAVRLRVNWFRAMAGIPADVAFSAANNAKCQQAALMMSANDALSHTPPNTWLYYTADGAQAAANSDLYLGRHGPDSITGYIEDPGAENDIVGHRRWILYPQTQTMGTGDVPTQDPHFAANALWVFDGNFGGTRPSVRDDFVAWPPPGYVPYQLIFPRWSFSYPGADFTNATVSLSRNGQTLANTLEPIATGYGENTIAWVPADQPVDSPTGLPAPAQDVPTIVTISGVKIGAQTRSFTYTVRMFDPVKSGADTVLAAISGPDVLSPNTAAGYACAAVPRATGYDWEVSAAASFTASEGAENGLANVTAKTSAGYNVISTLNASGANSFHLANPDFTRQTLELNRVIVPGATSQLQWKSRFGWAGFGQTARVQVSVDDGRSWQDVFSQTGDNTSGEDAFISRSFGLTALAGRAIRVRFSFDYAQGLDAYTDTDDGVGWYLDDITVTAADELTSPTLTHVDASTAFTFPATPVSARVLRVRPVFYNTYASEWAPVKSVTISVPPPSGTVEFSAPTYSQTEPASGTNVMTITVNRTGGSVGAASVQVAVSGNSASNPADFAVASPVTLNWADGDSAAKTFDITIKADAVIESAETFNLTLQNATVASLGGQATATINDGTPVIPLVQLGGRCNGLISATSTPLLHSGMINVTIGKLGKFTGKVTLGGVTLPISGTFAANGAASFGKTATATVELVKKAKPANISLGFLALSLDVGSGDKITGTLKDASGTTTLGTIARADRAFYTAKKLPVAPLMNVPVTLLDPTKEKGKYTAIFGANAAPNNGVTKSGFAQGDGFASVTVSSAGVVKIIGGLADGSKVSYANALSKNNELPVFVLLYKGGGFLSGNVAFDPAQPQTDAACPGMDWFKPATAADKLYPGGWPNGITTDFVVSKYLVPTKPTTKNPTPPNPDTVLGAGVAGALDPANIFITTADGGLTTNTSNDAILAATSKVTVLGASIGSTAATALKAAFAPKSGAMSGSFTHPGTGKAVKFAGVVFQKTHTASGYFIFFPPKTAAPGTLAESGAVGVAQKQ